MKKAIFYTMDAFLASMLLLGAVALIYSSYTPENMEVEQQTFISRDILAILSELRMYELNNSFIQQEVANGNLTDLNKTLLDQIGEYWALNKVDKAQILLQTIINDSLPEDYGIKTSMGNNTLLLRNVSGKTNSVASNRMISGIEQGRPLTGSSGMSYLKKIRNKKTSSYAYFGGFVGQGNITISLTLPSDFNGSRMINALLKIDTIGTFKLYINAQQCGTTYNGLVGNISLWDISGCNNSFAAGKNNISMIFTSSLNISYISGGFLKATYTTDTLIENTTVGYYKYEFPSIEGFINLYDAISVPGIIDNWTLNISYDSIYSTFFTLRNETIFIDPGQNSTRNIYISRINQYLSPGTVPIRMTHTNLTNITILNEGLPSDSFLVTDVSGSMDDCAQYANQTWCEYEYQRRSGGNWRDSDCVYDNVSCADNDCNEPVFYAGRNYQLRNHTVCIKTLLDIAKEAGKLFVAVILNESTLHRVGLVDYSTNANTPTNLTNVKSVLDNEIDSYVSEGYTCTCCGINRARNLINFSTSKRFMIVLSDGEPNYYCSNYNDYTGTDGTFLGNISASWAVNASRLACQNNITVYAIGFGSAMTASGHNVMRQIACNSSLYYNATNVSQLVRIYSNISQQILLAANFSSQTINIQGTFNKTRLLENSYMEVYYEDISDLDTQNKLSIVTESEQFNGCNASIHIPAGIAVQDAYMTSYSGNHWTKSLKVNNDVVFNLTDFGSSYDILGDPFIVQIPAYLLIPGQYNNISLSVGDTPTNFSNCSNNNTLIYTILVSTSTSRTDALEKVEGCNWMIESTTSTFNIAVPKEYTGMKTCNYTSAGIYYDTNDVYDVSVYSMLKQLDYENNGKIFFDLTQNDLEIILLTTGQVAYMWGPSLMKIEVWQ
jgi:hypothetical protein